MKEIGWFAVAIGAIVFALAIITAAGNAFAAQNSFDAPTGFPWQAQVGIEAVIALIFLLPGIALVSKKDQ